MGNRPITVGVETDHSDYTAGSKLRGKVYLSVNDKPGQAVSAQCLQLKLVGRENAVIHHHRSNDSGDSEYRSQDRYERWTNSFFQVEYALHTFPNQRAPSGQYEYPFSISLPQNLPSSLTARSGKSNCAVEYELIATVLQPGGSGLFQSNPQASKKISMSACVEEGGDTSVHQPVDIIPVKCCCCFCCCCCSKQGAMALETALDKTVVGPNDNIGVQFRCKNNSSMEVRKIYVQMEQIIEWNCNMHKKHIKQILDKKEFSGRSYPELMASAPKPTGCCRFGGVRYDVSQDTPLLQAWHVAQLQVPPSSQDSYQGQAIQVRHVVSVILASEGCCNSNPESATMVQVVRNRTSTSSTASNNAAGKMDDPFEFSPSEASAHHSTLDDNEFATAQAYALPPDWHAQTAEVVEIPMAQAIVVEPSAPKE
eukprot:scaffold6052_cov118-Cylindrotheca_fusiformis.AAC.7